MGFFNTTVRHIYMKEEEHSSYFKEYAMYNRILKEIADKGMVEKVYKITPTTL